MSAADLHENVEGSGKLAIKKRKEGYVKPNKTT